MPYSQNEVERALVLGLGVSGAAAAGFLLQRGVQVTVREDRRTTATEAAAERLAGSGAAIEWGPDYPRESGMDLIVTSPGIPPAAPILKSVAGTGAEVIGEVEIGWRHFRGTTIAVTGTNGKSTTTQLIEAALQAGGLNALACGNIGVPISEVAGMEPQPAIAILEISSFQLETIVHFSPAIAVYLNFSPDHLDRYPDLGAYRVAKDRIYLNLGPGQTAIVRDGLRVPKGEFDVIRFASGDGATEAPYRFRDGVLFADGHPVLNQSETRLAGPHQAENQLAALAVARKMGVADADYGRAMRGYEPLEHRCEPVGEHGGVTFINDSKATNPDAMERALAGHAGNVHLIAGGKDKGFDYASCRESVSRHCRAVYLIGEAADALERAWGREADCCRCASLEEAVSRAFHAAQPGDVVLLSPGCSSFDQYTNYQERGNHFKDVVNRLIHQPQPEKQTHE